ncbi:hypothetical protein TorRG33x02_164250 [Trema orientale]|uniref:Uncharacterized protein n=1 Tax=Trema orientale TaxID=63057 RepID=A0A2P5EQ97_TREOI|nr:hypothetical protein TorRG33x02_164250 [Trema orientale]
MELVGKKLPSLCTNSKSIIKNSPRFLVTEGRELQQVLLPKKFPRSDQLLNSPPIKSNCKFLDLQGMNMAASTSNKELWEPYQQSCRKVAGLKEYIQTFSYLTNEKVKYLEECLIKERRKGAIQKQMISELQHGQGEGPVCINSCTMLEKV